MSQQRKKHLHNLIKDLAIEYQKLDNERNYLINNAQNRIAEIQTIKADLLTEAQEQLVRLNALRVADGESELTLQNIREHLKSLITKPNSPV